MPPRVVSLPPAVRARVPTPNLERRTQREFQTLFSPVTALYLPCDLDPNTRESLDEVHLQEVSAWAGHRELLLRRADWQIIP